MSSLAYEVIANLKKEKANLESQIDTSQYAQQSYDEKPEAGSSLDTRNAIIEVKGAAGGDEANIFAKELLRMYIRYCERNNIQKEMLDEFSVKIINKRAFETFKFESGVHRVQRDPLTEKRGRIHTSTAVFGIMPELQNNDLHIRPEDIVYD